jgi:hypothetical protein
MIHLTIAQQGKVLLPEYDFNLANANFHEGAKLAIVLIGMQNT